MSAFDKLRERILPLMEEPATEDQLQLCTKIAMQLELMQLLFSCEITTTLVIRLHDPGAHHLILTGETNIRPIIALLQEKLVHDGQGLNS